jgi:serine-type D-Ala-D-Ala carboxypeptidase/endopeptidase (penicillin-binding protein 4)
MPARTKMTQEAPLRPGRWKRDMPGSLHFPLVTRTATIVLTVMLSACHPLSAPPDTAGTYGRRAMAQRNAAPRRTTLQRDIDATLSAPDLARSTWGVVIKSVQTDETLFAVNAGKLMMPASTMKIVTLAAAAAKLGWDYTYETTLRGVGTIANGVLTGDLVVVGSGDPSLVATDGAANRVFASWADRLKASGIQTISGRVVGDATAVAGETLGFGWSWDDLAEGFAAGVGGLQFNEGAVQVVVAPGPSQGASAAISVAPAAGKLTVDNGVVTSAAADQAQVNARRLPGADRLILRGSIPIGHTPIVLTASVDNPTRFFVNAARTALIDHGIDVRGPAVDRVDLAEPPPTSGGRVIASYRSPPLATLAQRLMKASQNQYAETLLKTTGPAQPILRAWGIEPADVIQRDGSGLSRYDYVTPTAIVTILTHIARDPGLKAAFEASLPIAGRDGSLANRMKGTAAEGNARAKTGSMANIRALAGYVTSGDGEPLAFSIIANNFEVQAETILGAIDAIVVRLAEFRR